MPEKPDYQDIDKTIRIEPAELETTPPPPAPPPKPEGHTRKVQDLTTLLSEGYRTIVSTITQDSTSSIDIDITADLETLEPVTFAEHEAEPASEELGQLEAQFEIKNEIAQGGQGRIEAARDKVFHRIVAVKSLHDEYKNRADRRHAFLTEAKVTAQLDHPAIVPVYGLYEDDENGLHLAMKLIRGKTLKEYLEITCQRYRRLSQTRIIVNERRLLWQRLEIFLRVCEAVSYVHHRKVIHRDLKPENIMIGSFNETYVMDWGIAENQTGEMQPPTGGKLSGTLQYIAPEVINKRPYDQRSDIFLLGLILYELVFLKQAYATPKNREEAVSKARNCRFEPFEHEFGVKVDRNLAMIIAKALSPDPDKRYKTAKALAGDLRNYRRGEATEANPEGPVDTIMRKVRNHYKLLLFFSALMLLLFTTVSVFALSRELKNRDREERREKALSAVYSTGLRSCARFDRLFRGYEALLTSISREASLLLAGEERHFSDRLYTYTDGLKPATAPADFTYAPTYRKKIALSTLIYILPDERRTPELEHDMRLLYPLKRSFAAALFQSLDDISDAEDKSDAEKAAIIRDKIKPPLLVAYLGLATGLHVGYPYETDYDPGYDPRQRPWYQDALKHPGVAFWGPPYIDTGEVRDTVITCSRTVISEETGEIIGVAAADISLARLLDLLEQTGNTGSFVDQKFLVDRRGKIIADNRLHSDPGSPRQDERLEFQRFNDLNVLSSMWEQENGWVFRTEEDKNFLYFFFWIESLDWLYVEKIDFDQLLSSH